MVIIVSFTLVVNAKVRPYIVSQGKVLPLTSMVGEKAAAQKILSNIWMNLVKKSQDLSYLS